MTEAPGAPKRTPSSSLPWLIAAALVVGLGLLGVFLFARDESAGPEPATISPNANSAANVNATSNTNVALNTNADIVPADWRTYRDERSQRTVQYPPEWEPVTTSYATVGFRPRNTQPGDPEWAAIYLAIRPNPSALALEPFYAEAEDFADLFEVSTSHEPRTVGQYDATYFPVIPGAVSNAALAFGLDDDVIEVQLHRDQIDKIAGVEDTFFSIAASVR